MGAAQKRLAVVGDDGTINGRDPLKLANSNAYEELGFYTKSSDRQGHSDQVNCKIPQGDLGAIQYLITQYGEYRSVQDFIRDAITHLMHKRNDQLAVEDERVSTRIKLNIMQSRMQQMADEMADLQAAVTSGTQILKESRMTGDRRVMQQALEQAIEMLDELRDPYRETLLDEVKKHQAAIQ